MVYSVMSEARPSKLDYIAHGLAHVSSHCGTACHDACTDTCNSTCLECYVLHQRSSNIFVWILHSRFSHASPAECMHLHLVTAEGVCTVSTDEHSGIRCCVLAVVPRLGFESKEGASC